MELSVEIIKERYSKIEEKIPLVWESYEKAGISLAQDIVYHWDINDAELIRVIALIESRVPNLRLNQHIDNKFAYVGLYPNVMKSYDILPDGGDNK